LWYGLGAEAENLGFVFQDDYTRISIGLRGPVFRQDWIDLSEEFPPSFHTWFHWTVSTCIGCVREDSYPRKGSVDLVTSIGLKSLSVVMQKESIYSGGMVIPEILVNFSRVGLDEDGKREFFSPETAKRMRGITGPGF
jgi:hypothetical protein